MERRSWLWRRKSSEKSPGETESSVGSISSHSERFSDDQVYLIQNSQSLEVTLKPDPHQIEHNHDVKTISEKLSEALASVNAKEELVNQHIKVAEEAVSGWEKAEREVLALRKQIEVLTIKNSTLENRVVHLDGALKECLRQLRQTREEKDQIAHEALEKKISETESSLTSIDTDLNHKLKMAEKENSDLKLEISSMTEELELRIIERELRNQAAEQASKQHLDSVKKVAKLEAECRRLNSALQKANNHQLKTRKMSLILENGDFKETSRFGRNRMNSLAEIDLLNDFLEMERLVAVPESYEVEEKLKKVESLEIVLKERENELNGSRNRIEEIETKLTERENELKASRNWLQETESKLAECENELKASRNRLEETESKLDERENELKASRKWIKESEFKLAERENELKASRNRLEEAEFKLGEHEKELKASRYQFEEAESKLGRHEIELKASRYLLEEAETKLAKTTNRLEMAEAAREAAYVKKEEAESQCKALKAELEILLPKVDYLENIIQKERDFLKEEVSRLQHEVQDKISGNRAEEFRFLKIKQETELAVAGSKFAECQKTFASLNRQLTAMATLDDFLIDTNDT